ncbi:MAG: flagellin N-terminal helical domain-containing protein [Bacillota bacterium]
MRINHNIAALNSYRQLTANQVQQGKSLEKLSSGLRINRAGDDAAGLAISEKMRGQIRGLEQASRNAQDGISMIQTAEGGLNEIHSILQRMRELAVQASNDTLTSADRDSIGTEMDELVDEIDRIATNTKFNSKSLLDGSLGVSRDSGTLTNTVTGLANLSDILVAGATSNVTYTISATDTGVISLTNGDTSYKVTLSAVGNGVNTLDFGNMGIKITTDSNFVATAAAFDTMTVITSGTSATFQLGADANQTMSISVSDMDATALSVNALDISDTTAAQTSITSVDTAIATVSTQRATLGAYQNRLEHSINNLSASAENLTASESRIRDVDMAKEMMEFTKSNILNQAATAMLAQANQTPQTILELLR